MESDKLKIAIHHLKAIATKSDSWASKHALKALELMNELNQKMTIEDLKLSVRGYNVLKRAGVNFVDELKGMSYEEITNIYGMHIKVLEEIEDTLGIKFEKKPLRDV
ncbi:DNA-directed RNA polymerase subunit alpha C-terminal domain-containing protein (plasmid) [Aneurinibacillus sp. Ricciae_BoGa-3]|uniref:DNA-directed RNA polymerase subunit alpha C-terminal domain-containing protein n=1 Tax=Aneurinibacillus sp. Ricciae_BoGa-3 TaxID=3022697 RepID=UPI0023410F29|nr:DNA-directed RNA polymerase subunit alpha C-terminal domain-containing protein [Aneurinibacillus sp. Ricciae_BoGa-3]WCK57292.1 DNA-directed RNA polymerase subunit alpha C-terminal domain-containing protein [Aneurinibacillus sp. Ricciae_BoGa-3]